jgi:hypothetical protein
MIFSLFQSNKATSQPNPSAASDQTQTPKPDQTQSPKQPETTKSSVQSNKLSFRLSDKTLYEAITNWCRINNVSLSKFIMDAIRAHAQNLQLNVNQQAPVQSKHQQPVQQTVAHQQQQTAIPVSINPPQNDPAAQLMEQWKNEARVDQQRYEIQYIQETGNPPPRPKQGWIEQPPSRYSRNR